MRQPADAVGCISLLGQTWVIGLSPSSVVSGSFWKVLQKRGFSEAQRRRLTAAARAAFKSHEECLASVRQVPPGLGRVGVQLSLWDMLDTPPVAADVPLELEMVETGEVL
jgi:hypothetical protein